MKLTMAVTICQPYAHLIAVGEKWVENRSWPTRHRGPIAIHAGKSRDWLDADDEARYPDMVFGAVVAIATLDDCVHVNDLREPTRSHEHANGPWCWVLRDVRPLRQPVAVRGAQGLWFLTAEVSASIVAQAAGVPA